MKIRAFLWHGFTGLVALLCVCDEARAAYGAAEVVSYTAGTGASPSLQNHSAVLGTPGPSVPGSFGYPASNFCPFTPHWSGDEILQVGHGGELTLRLERFVEVSPAGREIGIWENVFLVQGTGAPGTARNPATVSGSDTAVVEVSADGISFVSLGTVTFNWFGNYWTDSPGPSATGGTVMADFGKPFTGNLGDFNGKSYADILSGLDGSAGGTWIDLDPSGLSQVGWVRFSGVSLGATLDMDAVAINTSLAGASTIPEPSSGILITLILFAAYGTSRTRLHAR